jgi:hypothetical protein
MRYPRCFIALNGNFPIEIEQQIYDMREGGKNIYLPSIGKRNSSLDNQINTIGKIDSEFEKRYNFKIIVLADKFIDAFTLMILSEYNPKFYWIDSKTDFDKIMYCSQNFEDFQQMNVYLHAASQNYWFAFNRIKTHSGGNVFQDEFIESIFQRDCWATKSNAETATRVWIKNQLKIGILNRLDL